MSADISRIEIHVTALLNAMTRSTAGVPNYTATVGDKARSAAEIAETCLQAALVVAKTICETDSHPFRTAFIAETAVTHGAPIPFHYGDVAPPTITPFNGATFTLKGTRRSYDKIEAYRLNPNNLYSKVAHNAGSGTTPSDLAGFYDIVNGIFYFTGYSATVPLATFDRSNVITRLDEGTEPIIVKLACANSAKEGDVSDGIFASWKAEAQNELGVIRSGQTVFSPVEQAIAQRGL